tara:strand:+ start:313 stop:510 length:198 start_codon:yes stop_codon:yes gene_type:complete
MSWFKKFIKFITPPSSEKVVETEIVRARNKKGRYVADDPNTLEVNEAYKTVKVTKKKRGRPRKKK